MYYLVSQIIQNGYIRKLQDERDHVSPITLRGWETSSKEIIVPSELAGVNLSVGDIAGGYCPTNRDLFLRKIKGKRQPPTWGRYQGRKIHQTYEVLNREIQNYTLNNENGLDAFDMVKHCDDNIPKLLDSIMSDFKEEAKRMQPKPTNLEVESFEKELTKIVRFESRLAGSMLDSVVATSFDVKMGSELADLFPLQVMEPSLNAPPLGFSPGVKPDFLIQTGSRFIGDIKTGPPKEFHRLTVAAYALAYEYKKQEPMDFGIVFRVNTSPSRSVPDYRNTEFFVISDKYRKAVAEVRNAKFQILKSGKDPGESSDASLCSDCPYYPGCRNGN